MRNALPVLMANVEPLQQRLQPEHHSGQKPRLQLRSRLASGQAQSRQDVARLLGGHRQPIGHWPACDATGGLEALLDLSVPPGKPFSLLPDVLAGLEPALRPPAGLAAYEAVRPWLKPRDQLAVKDHTLYTIVHTRSNAKRKGPRPSHPNKPGRYSGLPGALSGAAPGRHPT
jgi:hypothetical protein